MEGIVEPVAAPLERRLRRAVFELAGSERRRRYPPVLHVGEPGGHQASLEIDGATAGADLALRVDVLAALVRRARLRTATPVVWLSRPGSLRAEQDVDVDWLAATRTAGAELAVHLPFVVINRRAWRDPRTGVGRVWQRPRPHRTD